MQPTNRSTAIASRKGILLTGGEKQLEDAANIRTILFDKTGTLTTGVLRVHKEVVEASWKTSPANLAILWAAIGQIEQHSKHPVAALLAEESRRQRSQTSKSYDEGFYQVEVLNVRIYESLGIGAIVHTTIGDLDVVIGSQKLMRNITTDDSPLFGLNTAPDSAHSSVHVSVNGEVAMSVVYSDAIRLDALSTIETLRAQGIQVGLVTGDTEISARRISSAVGIEPEWTFGNCLPTDKVQIVNQMYERFGPIAMVGDHFNDIPALASSSFSISISSYSEISPKIDTDAYLTQATKASFDLLRIPYLLALTRRTNSKIQTNVWWAIIYNLTALILSSGSLQFLHPSLVLTP
jgi:cation transport ATPase